MIKRFIAALILSSAIIAGCVKSDNKCSYKDSGAAATAPEIDSIKHFLSDSGITASQHSSGFFYTINNQGTGTGIANLCTNVTVTYKGSLFSGQVFDSTAAGNAAVFQLGTVVVGWQRGLPLISKGGDITLYIPPSLGFGGNTSLDSQGNIIIPANSYLKFDIHIIDIN
jgi:FKBP-type peptidyl-prolyl cis-trans isomerase FkpA